MNKAINVAGILTALGNRILLVMLKDFFKRSVGFLGIVMRLGFGSDALRDVIGSGYVLCGVYLPTWCLQDRLLILFAVAYFYPIRHLKVADRGFAAEEARVPKPKS